MANKTTTTHLTIMILGLVVTGLGATLLCSVVWLNWLPQHIFYSLPVFVFLMYGGPVFSFVGFLAFMTLWFFDGQTRYFEMASYFLNILGVILVFFLGFAASGNRYPTALPIFAIVLIIYRFCFLMQKRELDSTEYIVLGTILLVSIWLAQIFWLFTHSCAFGACV